MCLYCPRKPFPGEEIMRRRGESLLAVVDGRLVDLRVPYPLGFFTKLVDGRIDDPNAGWKGRALWTRQR
jgi:hypothetical protein